ncbi:MAG: hypothetical protein WDW36_009024 [Sanguina aurantia]
MRPASTDTTQCDDGFALRWKGALEVMYTAARSPDILCSFTQANKMMQGRSFPLCPSAVDALDELGTPALILWQAGGNFGDLWTFVQHPRMQMIQAFDALIDADERYAGYNLTILQLPQSVFYTNQNVMKKEAHILRNLKRVRFVLTTRATASYDIAVNEMRLPVENVFAVPDIASAAGPFLGSDPPLVDIVLMPRSDREAKLTPLMAAEIVNRTATAAGLTFKVNAYAATYESPINHPQPLYSAMTDVRAASGIGLLTQGQVVITDLMHTSLMSMLSGKPVFFWDGGRPACPALGRSDTAPAPVRRKYSEADPLPPAPVRRKHSEADPLPPAHGVVTVTRMLASGAVIGKLPQAATITAMHGPRPTQAPCLLTETPCDFRCVDALTLPSATGDGNLAEWRRAAAWMRHPPARPCPHTPRHAHSSCWVPGPARTPTATDRTAPRPVKSPLARGQSSTRPPLSPVAHPAPVPASGWTAALITLAKAIARRHQSARPAQGWCRPSDCLGNGRAAPSPARLTVV